MKRHSITRSGSSTEHRSLKTIKLKTLMFLYLLPTFILSFLNFFSLYFLLSVLSFCDFRFPLLYIFVVPFVPFLYFCLPWLLYLLCFCLFNFQSLLIFSKISFFFRFTFFLFASFCLSLILQFSFLFPSFFHYFYVALHSSKKKKSRN